VHVLEEVAGPAAASEEDGGGAGGGGGGGGEEEGKMSHDVARVAGWIQ
jgi:hypothetical protein